MTKYVRRTLILLTLPTALIAGCVGNVSNEHEAPLTHEETYQVVEFLESLSLPQAFVPPLSRASRPHEVPAARKAHEAIQASCFFPGGTNPETGELTSLQATGENCPITTRYILAEDPAGLRHFSWSFELIDADATGRWGIEQVLLAGTQEILEGKTDNGSADIEIHAAAEADYVSSIHGRRTLGIDERFRQSSDGSNHTTISINGHLLGRDITIRLTETKLDDDLGVTATINGQTLGESLALKLRERLPRLPAPPIQSVSRR